MVVRTRLTRDAGTVRNAAPPRNSLTAARRPPPAARRRRSCAHAAGLTWTSSQPTPAQHYDFSCADRIFAFMKKHNMAYAHTNAVMSCAHNVEDHGMAVGGLPPWLTDGYPYSTWSRRDYPYTYTRAEVRGFLQMRIAAVVPKWMSSADVRAIIPVNEAIANQPYVGRGGWPHTWITGAKENIFSWAFGNATHNSTAWFGQAFKWVRAAADGAGATKLKLFYNDYGIETPGGKQDATLRLLTEQKAAGVPIDGIGFQAHLRCDCRLWDGSAVTGCNSSAVIAAGFDRFIKAGFKVAVTELDVQMVPGCTPAMQAAVYGAVLEACLSVGPACDSFMVWGFSDHIYSPGQWLAGTHPAIFDGDFHAKESYFTLQKILAAKAYDARTRLEPIAAPVVPLTDASVAKSGSDDDSTTTSPPVHRQGSSNANNRAIRVGASAAANTSTIASAVSMVPLHQTEGWTILVEAGVYRERVYILPTSGPITMRGLGPPEETMLVYHCAGNGNGQPRCPRWANATEGDKECYPRNTSGVHLLSDFVQTLYVAADDFTMMNMTVSNDACGWDGTQRGGSPTLRTMADKSFFQHVRILGGQDTLYTGSECNTCVLPHCSGGRICNRQYFLQSYINGSCDSIFGSSNLVLDRCDIGVTDHVTAMRGNVSSTGSRAVYLFFNSSLVRPLPTDSNYKYWPTDLGRPWAHPGHKLEIVVHINTWMDSHIESFGWSDWGQHCDKHPTCHTDPTCDCQNVTYAEFRSHGPGATPSKLAARPKWTFQLSEHAAEAYTPLSVMHGWVPPAVVTPPPPPSRVCTRSKVVGCFNDTAGAGMVLTGPEQYQLHDHVTLGNCASACAGIKLAVAGIDGGNHCRCGSVANLASAEVGTCRRRQPTSPNSRWRWPLQPSPTTPHVEPHAVVVSFVSLTSNAGVRCWILNRPRELRDQRQSASRRTVP